MAVLDSDSVLDQPTPVFIIRMEYEKLVQSTHVNAATLGLFALKEDATSSTDTSYCFANCTYAEAAIPHSRVAILVVKTLSNRMENKSNE